MNGFRDGSDGELWRRAAAEPDAFGELFERHAHAVYAFCARRTADLGLAEDLTSVVFLEAWRRRGSVELQHDSALPWLLGIANNLSRNARRSVRRGRAALARLPPALAGASAEDDAIERADAERALKRATEAIAGLARAEREVVVLVLWSDLSYEQAALALGVPVGTVRSRLARARHKLQDSLSVSLTATEEPTP